MPDTVVYFDATPSVVDAVQGEITVITAGDAGPTGGGVGGGTPTQIVNDGGNISIDGSGAITAVSAGAFNATSVFATSIDSGTNLQLTAATFVDINTNGVLRVEFKSDGSWDIGGSVGSGGQVLTSNGAASPTWGFLLYPPTNITFADTPYAVLVADYAIFANTSGGTTEVVLPASPTNGRLLNVKKVSTDANNFTLNGNGKTIDGAATVVTAAVNRPNLQILYDSSANDWRIL